MMIKIQYSDCDLVTIVFSHWLHSSTSTDIYTVNFNMDIGLRSRYGLAVHLKLSKVRGMLTLGDTCSQLAAYVEH